MRILQLIKERVQSLYDTTTLSELSGSLGDLGTLLPLLVALSTQRSIALAPALFFGGVANVVTGFVWDVPMCVQPMKSIAAVALNEEWTVGKVTASGVLVGAIMLLLGLTGGIELVNRIVPTTVVSGLQIGVGIRLASKGILMVTELSWIDSYDCIILGIICALLCMIWLREQPPPTTTTDNDDTTAVVRRNWWCQCCVTQKDHPVGLYLFGIGVIFASITLANNPNGEYDLPLQFFGAPIAYWAIDDVTKNDWLPALWEGALPQLPLTTLNSVISVCALAHSLYPEKRTNSKNKKNQTDAVVSRRDVAISVGIMNLLLCSFGSMPYCHGAGGLAGQHLLGARHGSSVVVLGFAKMTLAVFFAKSALTLLDAFPNAILGVMLTIAGQELATTGFTLLLVNTPTSNDDNDNNDDTDIQNEDEQQQRQQQQQQQQKMTLRQNTVVAVITAIVIISLGMTHYGALCGFVVHMLYGSGMTDLMSWYRDKRRSITTDEALSLAENSSTV